MHEKKSPTSFGVKIHLNDLKSKCNLQNCVWFDMDVSLFNYSFGSQKNKQTYYAENKMLFKHNFEALKDGMAERIKDIPTQLNI